MVNKAIVLGNLGKDPEVRFTPSGRAVCQFPLATSEKWTDQNGERQEKTVWHNIVVWGKQAETCGQYLSKGSQVFVEGRIDNRSYDDKDGVKKYISEIIAKDVRFIGSRGDAGPSKPAEGGAGADTTVEPADDDIPF